YTITDQCGNAVTASQTIFVEDTTAPTASNPNTITVPGGPAPAPDVTVVTDEADNCGTTPVVAFVSDVSDNGNCPETITRTYSVTDTCNNQILVTQTILITDPIMPTASNPNGIDVQCIDDVPAPDVTVVTDEADNQGTPVVAFVSDVSDGNTCPERITRTYSVTDICNNQILVTQTITVNDTTVPTATGAIANSTVEGCTAADATAPVTSVAELEALGLTIADNCTDDANLVVTNTDTSNGNCPIEVSRTYTITDQCGNAVTASQTIFVEDTTAPVISGVIQTTTVEGCIASDATPAVSTISALNALGLTINDSCSSDTNLIVTSSDTASGSCPIQVIRTYTITDSCGNFANANQTILVDDTTAPVLTLPANVTAQCSDDLSTTAFGVATAIDNCDSNPVIAFTDVITNGSCSGDFTITRTWTATDACGNVASGNQIISTQDTTTPEFDQTNLPGDIVVECNSIPQPVTLTATDNCGTATVTVNDVRTDGNCPNNYTITRSYTATDDCGVTNTHVQTITVQDSTPPSFVESLPNPNIVVQCDDIPQPEMLTAIDICGSAIVSVTDSRTDGDCPNSYSLARTWVATDECGLTTTYTQNIIVQDTTPPIFVESLPRDITVECDDIPEASTLTATDNCGDATVTVSDVRTNGDCPNSYFLARTWVATDECGLTTTHTQIITVQDTTAPKPASSFEIELDVSCTDIPEVPEITFTDNCSSNVVVVFDETNTFDENVIADYQIIRTWTVRDACNNEEDYTQTLNVSLDEILNEVVAEDRCFDNGVVNLDDFLAEGTFGGTWELIEGNPVATVNGSIFDPTNLDSDYSESFNPNTDGIEYVLRYTGFQDGCINITDVIMVIDAKCRVLPCGEKDIDISTAITPNGDDYNKTFDIEGITLCGFQAHVKIFNRWGALVYESDNYKLGSERDGDGFGTDSGFGKWDGTAPKSAIGNNGKLPNGTYYYIIQLRDPNSGKLELKPITGPVYLGTK
ncbi:gliding motility-associated C-terminal domain-containing protein, partial [uncultured Algibacter sp.]|uniref:gliding motility-associated C-terminal domain-containing protein n=1 Tax=uncultured Algibacter sp. TaxID=298659 RepID=UPI00260D39A1